MYTFTNPRFTPRANPYAALIADYLANGGKVTKVAMGHRSNCIRRRAVG